MRTAAADKPGSTESTRAAVPDTSGVAKLVPNEAVSAEETLRALISAANDAGGHDNITAVLVTIGPVVN